MSANISVVMIGASGAVGGEVVQKLCDLPDVTKVTLLGRRKVEGIESNVVQQHVVDLLDPSSYQEHVNGHTVGISTLGVGQPSKVSKEEFTRIDKDAVVDFATACQKGGVRHFQSLGSIGIDDNSRSFYLRSKGELEQKMMDIGFDRLSLFHPSMIITPANRYGVMQGITLKVWPILSLLFVGRLRKLRGIRTSELGAAFANNLVRPGQGTEVLEWDEFVGLAAG